MPRAAAARTVVVVPGGGARRRAAPARRSTAGRIARRAGSAAARYGAKLAAEEKHTLSALGAAAFIGLATRFGWNLPKLPGTSPALTFGLAAWAAGRFTKNEIARHVATGLLSVGLYDVIAYTGRTRDEIQTLLERQREEEEEEGTEGVRGGFGQLGG